LFEKLRQKSCQVANRVSLTMVFAESSSNPAHFQRIIDEALTSTNELLDLIDPSELRQWFERFSNIYSSSGYCGLLSDPTIWSAFVGAQCDLLQRVGFHQKTIASLGDDLAVWDREPVSMEQLGEALDDLACLTIDQPVALSAAIERQAGNESSQKRRATAFSHAICGIAIVLVAIDETNKKGESRESGCASIAMFGASLIKRNVASLLKACSLNTA